MIGYNIDEINALIATLRTSYKNLGETMATGWDNVSFTLGDEWIGPDELSFETELAKRICSLYETCYVNLKGMVENIKKLGDTWKEFQNANLLQGSVTLQTVDFDITAGELEIYDIASVVKAADRTFTSSRTLGVVNGRESAVKINNKVTEYVNAVGESVKAMYNQTSSAKAFLAATEAETIDTYLKNMANSFAQIVTQVTDMQEALTKLVENYESQMQSNVSQVNTIDTSAPTTTTSVQQ